MVQRTGSLRAKVSKLISAATRVRTNYFRVEYQLLPPFINVRRELPSAYLFKADALDFPSRIDYVGYVGDVQQPEFDSSMREAMRRYNASMNLGQITYDPKKIIFPWVNDV